MSLDKVLDQIKSLFEKTEANGCSVAEAATAAKVAQQLMDKYNVSISDLENSEFEPVDQDLIFEGKRLVSWKINLATSIARANKCKCLIINHNNKYAITKVIIIGSTSNRKVVNYFFTYLSRMIEVMAKDHLNKVSTGRKGAKTISNSFKLGAVSEISQRLAEQKAQTRKDIIASNSNGLARINKELSLVDEWISSHYGRTGTVERKSISVNRDSFNAGKQAASNIGLHQGITGSSSSKKLLS